MIEKEKEKEILLVALKTSLQILLKVLAVFV